MGALHWLARENECHEMTLWWERHRGGRVPGRSRPVNGRFPLARLCQLSRVKLTSISETRQELWFRWLPAAIENSRCIAFQAPGYSAPRIIERDIGIEVRLGYNLDDG